MPLKLNVGLSKKVGLPDYGSLGASCNIELELDSSLLQSNLDGLQRHIRAVYVACAQAVQDELVRQGTCNPPATIGSSSTKTAGRVERSAPSRESGATRGNLPKGHGPRQVSKKQVEYANQLADRIEGLGIRGLAELTGRMFGKQLADLSSLEASGLIETLRDIDAGKIDVLAALQGAAA